MKHELHLGDCVEVMARFEDNCVDALVSDPPYGLKFMSKKWDRLGSDIGEQIEWHVRWAVEALRLLKPGGHALIFNHSRTDQYLKVGLEVAGFEIRDTIDWFYFNGFPKSRNDVADGIGTALKPAKEPIVLARKPLIGTLAENESEYGTGLLNIDACRMQRDDVDPSREGELPRLNGVTNFRPDGGPRGGEKGRWPANVIIDELVARELDLRCGDVGAKAPVSGNEPSEASEGLATNRRRRVKGAFHSDKGGPSRFFYCPKPSRAEREFGCEGLPLRSAGEVTDREDGSAGLNSPRAGAGRLGGARNYHPTLKPIALMQYLCRLITPADGIVLDPFTGSGTTGIAALREGFRFVGIEKEVEYLIIANARVSAAAHEGVPYEAPQPQEAHVTAGQRT